MDAIDKRFLVSPDLFEQEEWVIEVRWGFGTKWSVLSAGSFGSEEEAQSVIAGMRKLASAPGAHSAHIAYRDLPLRVAKLEVRSE